MPERATVVSRGEKSAEAVVAAGCGRRAERVGGPKAVSLERAVHQKPASAGRNAGGRGEAEAEVVRDEARPTRFETGGSGGDDLLAQALARASLVMAWKRVKANRGSAGVDGKSIAETAEALKTHWPRIREALLEGSYRPQPVRRVQIPKPGGGMRELGIPTVTDRLIQQALLQVLQPIIDPTFSEHSYVCSRRAGDRVLDGLRKRYDRLHLKVNEAKTAVVAAYGRKFLGYALLRSAGGRVKCTVARKALETFKQRIRELTRRSGGRSLPESVERLRAYLLGWKAYF